MGTRSRIPLSFPLHRDGDEPRGLFVLPPKGMGMSPGVSHPPNPRVLPPGRFGASFELWLDPEVPVVEYGGSIRLTLNTSCQDPDGRGDVETSFPKQRVSEKPGEVVVNLSNVTAFNSSNLAYYTCGSHRKMWPIKFIVYRKAPRGEGGSLPVLARWDQPRHAASLPKANRRR